MEREAAYFAKLLLYHREFLYYRKDDKIFNEVCDEWKILFKYIHGVHGNRGKKWLDWVLSDG